jgi:glycosyltransferase involved in cell wall biosynthesis
VAVIATDVGGTREIFPAELHAARLVPSDDASTLAAAIRALANDDAARRSLGASARRRAEQQFGIGAAVDGLLQHYRALA